MTLRNAFDSLAVETTQQEILSELQTQQKNSLTNSELRASPVPVSTGLVQPTTPTDTQPVSVNNLPLPNGAATAAKQLPDNHNVTVSNQVQQPLTDSQLRFSPVPVNTGLQQPTTPTDTQPVSAASLPLPTGAATDSKLEQIRILLNEIELNQLANNHQVSVSNFPLVFPLTDAQVTLLRTSKLDEALQNGVAYTGGGKITVTNNTAVLQLSNPAGSGKIIIVGQFFLASDQNIDVQFRRNATVNSPSVQTSDPLNLGSVVPAVGVLRTGSTGYSSAGSVFSPIGRLAANITTSYPLPLILPPGTSVSASFAAGGILTSTSCYASAAWIESPI